MENVVVKKLQYSKLTNVLQLCCSRSKKLHQNTDIASEFWLKHEGVSHLWKAEKRLLGDSSRGPRGRSVPPSCTHCRYPRVMAAMPMARAEQ